jgi:L-alanine-DL-glutamate epimerase-like enolase superfamily enzyme
MSIDIVSAEYHVTNPEMRTPFHFGNVAMTECPHVFLDLSVDLDGHVQHGSSMGGLIPMWFYKDPSMSLSEGLGNMIEVFRTAGALAEKADPAETAFESWRDVYERQREWAADTDYPPLLWGYGVSMVEQALIDAVCRHREVTFGEAVRENVLGISLGSIYDELEGYEPADLLPKEPRRSTAIRHTVGLTDPLTDDDIAASDRLEDGLPQSLSEYVREDGVDHFKIKLSADRERDANRLSRIYDVLGSLDVDDYAFTVDANEGYASARAFKQQWEALRDDPDRQSLLEHLLYVEQPLARDDAFSDETREVFLNWEGKPPIIIDESDDLIDRNLTALEHGYDGTSHKNCKGVFKGITNACLIAHRNRSDPDGEYILSAEDLTTIGPIELLQDLAVVATIGAGHVERNGHHYFRGLSAFPEEVQNTLLDAHGDLYRRHGEGFATLAIEDGEVDLNTVVDAPFGVGPAFDTSQFTPVETWVEERLADGE